MADTADTAMSFGVDATLVELASDLFEAADLWQPEHPDAMKFLDFLNGWVRLTNVLNELSRSMGQPDYYPFVLPRAAVGKLQFVHQVITHERERRVEPPVSREASPAPEQRQAQQQEHGWSPMLQQFQAQRIMRGAANAFRPRRRWAAFSPPSGFSG